MINAPLILCMAFMAGIIVGHFASVVIYAVPFVLIGLCRIKKYTLILFAIFFVIGQMTFNIAERNSATAIDRYAALNKTAVKGGGHVVEPVRLKNGETSVLVKCDQLTPLTINRAIILEVQVLRELKAGTGDYINFEGSFSNIKKSDSYRRSRHIYGRVHADNIKINKARSPIYSLSQEVNRQIRDIGERYISKDSRALFSGMLVGDVSHMNQEQKEDFKRSGLTHLVAVSGSNLAMIAVPLLFVLTWLGVHRIGRLLVAGSVIAFYATATGLQAPVLRASIMTLLALYAIFFVGQKKGLALLSIACIAMLTWDPFLLQNPGFLFSFASTLGLILLLNKFEELFGFMPPVLALPLASTVAAQIFVIPVSAYYFGEVSIASFGANMLAAPLVPLITNTGLAALLLNNILPAAALLPAFMSNVLLTVLVKISQIFGSFSWAMIDVNFSYALLFLYLLIIVLLISGRIAGKSKIKILISLLLITMTFLSWKPVILPARAKYDLEIHFLDVGQADSSLVRTKDGANILIDTGRNDKASLKKLKSLGVRKIDLLIISHFEQDHCGGILDILREYDVQTVMVPDIANPGKYEKLTAIYLKENNIPLIRTSRNDEWQIGNLKLKVLSPESNSSFDDLNNGSLVLQIQFGLKTFLFTGDIEQDVQDSLEADKNIKSDVLKIPHHGAADAADEEFLDAVSPSLAVISAGRNNPYGHPSAKYLAVLNKRSINTRRTDKDGNVKIASDGKTISFIEGGNLLTNLRFF